MSHPYAGNPVYPGTITIPDDGDLDAAIAYAVAFEQLADRCAALTGGVAGGSFTNATFHGTTTFADGYIVSTGIITIDFDASSDIVIRSATASVEIDALAGPITISAGADISVTSNANLSISGADFLDLNSGTITIDAATHTISIGYSGATINIPATAISFTAASPALDLQDAQVTASGVSVITSDGIVNLNGFVNLNGQTMYHSVVAADADMTVNGSAQVYEYILPNPSLVRGIALDHIGAQLGQRLRFNAQKVSGPQQWNIGYAGKLWQMRNAAGYTVKLELVCDGSAWIVDDWEAGGVSLRNG